MSCEIHKNSTVILKNIIKKIIKKRQVRRLNRLEEPKERLKCINQRFSENKALGRRGIMEWFNRNRDFDGKEKQAAPTACLEKQK